MVVAITTGSKKSWPEKSWPGRLLTIFSCTIATLPCVVQHGFDRTARQWDFEVTGATALRTFQDRIGDVIGVSQRIGCQILN
jgi:hypothetical protein